MKALPDPTLTSLTRKALLRLDERLDSVENLDTKDLTTITFGLLDRQSGRSPSSDHADALSSGAVRGAVVGMLEGLAKISGASFDTGEVEQRIVHPYPETEEVQPPGKKKKASHYAKAISE